MFGELNDDLILSADEINTDDLFAQDTEDADTNTEKTEEGKESAPEDIEIDTDNLFDTEETEHESGEDAIDNKEDVKSSPKSNFYSALATSLKEDGVFPDFDSDTIESIKTPEDFAKVIEDRVAGRLDERQRRIEEALNNNVEVSDIQMYENTIHNLNNITEDQVKDESNDGQILRQNIIYQDYINRGYSEDRAKREVKKSFDAGTDLEDAMDSLTGNKEYFTKQYQDLINSKKEETNSYQQSIKQQAEDLQKAILDDKDGFFGMTIDKSIKQQAYENITKPIHKTEKGTYLTAIQKAEQENPIEFRKKLAMYFTLTDGFTNMDKLIGKQAQKQVKNNLRNLEKTLTNSGSTPFGNPTFIGGSSDEDDSYSGKGWDLDI